MLPKNLIHESHKNILCMKINSTLYQYLGMVVGVWMGWGGMVAGWGSLTCIKLLTQSLVQSEMCKHSTKQEDGTRLGVGMDSGTSEE